MSHWGGPFTLCISGKPIKELGVVSVIIIILKIAPPVYLTPGQRTPLDLALFDPWEGFISFLDLVPLHPVLQFHILLRFNRFVCLDLQ